MPDASVFCQTLGPIAWLPFSGLETDNQVYVLRISLATFSTLLPDLYALLGPEEQQRASRYHRQVDQHRFIIVRGVLKIVLGLRTGQPAVTVQFETGSQKKPGLKGFPAVQYNVSHSGNWALLAVGQTSVGIDVEQGKPDFSYQEIMRHSFSSAEQGYVREAGHHWAFYRLWTRKEALLKATGKGIGDDLVKVPSLDGWHYPASHWIGQAGHWLIRSFLVDDAYQGALAVEAPSDQPMPVFVNLDKSLLRL